MEVDRDKGFTLIEMVIALVLATIVIGIAVAGIVGAVSSSASSRANSVSAAMLENASQLLASDASLAETADRRAGLVRDPADLHEALMGGGNPLSTHPTVEGSGPGGSADIDDVVVATPTMLRIKADVEDDAAGAVECVTWEAPSTGPNYILERTVQQTCGGSVISRTTVIKAPRTIPGLIDKPFSYMLQCHRPTCGAGSEAAPARPCETWPENNGVDDTRKRWIVGVRITIVGSSRQSSGVARSGSQIGMTLRSRDTTEWRGALGC